MAHSRGRTWWLGPEAARAEPVVAVARQHQQPGVGAWPPPPPARSGRSALEPAPGGPVRACVRVEQILGLCWANAAYRPVRRPRARPSRPARAAATAATSLGRHVQQCHLGIRRDARRRVHAGLPGALGEPNHDVHQRTCRATHRAAATPTQARWHGQCTEARIPRHRSDGRGHAAPAARAAWRAIRRRSGSGRRSHRPAPPAPAPGTCATTTGSTISVAGTLLTRFASTRGQPRRSPAGRVASSTARRGLHRGVQRVVFRPPARPRPERTRTRRSAVRPQHERALRGGRARSESTAAPSRQPRPDVSRSTLSRATKPISVSAEHSQREPRRSRRYAASRAVARRGVSRSLDGTRRKITFTRRASTTSQGSAISAANPANLSPLAAKASRLVRFDTGQQQRCRVRQMRARVYVRPRSDAHSRRGRVHDRREQNDRGVQAQYCGDHRRHHEHQPSSRRGSSRAPPAIAPPT